MFEAIVHVVDPRAFIREAYDKRSSWFCVHTKIEVTHLKGSRTGSASGSLVSIRSNDRMNVEDVLLVDLDMDQAEADSFIRETK